MARRRKGGSVSSRLFSASIRKEFEKPESVDDEGNIITRAEILAKILVKKAMGYVEIIEGVEIVHPPERWAIELLYDRMEGRVAAAEPEKLTSKTVAEKVGHMAKLSINSMTKAVVKGPTNGS